MSGSCRKSFAARRWSDTKARISTSFQAVELKQRDISILSDQFLAEVRGRKYKNVAVELLEKLLGDEIKVRSKWNLVQSRGFSAVTRVKKRPGFPVTDAKQRPGFPMLKMPSGAECTTNEFLACRETCSSIAHD